MGFELEIDGVLVPSRKWSGPGTLRVGYRGPEPGSREAGNANFTIYDTKILKTPPSLALSFDGVDDYVEVPDSPLLRFPAIMTVAFWMRGRNIVESDHIGFIGKGRLYTYGSFCVEFYKSTQTLYFLQSTSGTAWQTLVQFPIELSTNWHCIVAYNTGTAARIVVDGSPSTADFSPATGDLWINTFPLGFGHQNGWYGDRGRFADIELDEVVIAPYAWTEAQIVAFYNAGRGSRIFQGERLRWHLDDGGATARDEVSGLVGTVNGALWIRSTLAVLEEEDVLAEGKEVVIARNGKVRYRGIITGLDTGKRDTEVETAEMSARLNQLDAGLRDLGGLSNSATDWYQRSETIPATEEAVEIEGFSVRAAVTLPAIDYTKQAIFDSFVYTDHVDFPNARWRTNIWRERTISELAGMVIAAAAREGLTIRGLSLSSYRPKTQGRVQVYDEGGEKIEFGYAMDPARRGRRDHSPGEGEWGPRILPHGLLKRTIEGSICTYLWLVKEAEIYLYQLVNQGLGMLCGQFDLGSNYNNGDVWVQKPAENEEEQVIWCVAWPEGGQSQRPRGGRERSIEAPEIEGFNLRQVRDYRAVTDIELVYRGSSKVGGHRDRSSSTAAGEVDGGNHVARNGGYYQIDEAENEVVWVGDLFLCEAAFDFRGAKLGDVLHELALLTGCEWWVDTEGTLRIEPLDRAERSAAIAAKQILKQRVRERLDVETYEEFKSSGIPLGQYGEGLLRLALEDLSRRTQSQVTRVMEILPMGEPEYSLGAKTTVNGELVGRLTAIEHTRSTDTLELQPVGEGKKPVKK